MGEAVLPRLNSGSAEVKVRYGCLMVNVPETAVLQIHKWCASHIWTTHLAPDGYESKLHITVKYGFKDCLPHVIQAVRAMLCRHGPFPVRLKKLALFTGNEEGDVLHVTIESKELHELNEMISAEFDCHDSYPVYKPHLTLAYLDPAYSNGYTALDAPFLGQELIIEEAEFSDDNKRKTFMSLSVCNFAKAMSAYNQLSGAPLVGAETRSPKKQGRFNTRSQPRLTCLKNSKTLRLVRSSKAVDKRAVKRGVAAAAQARAAGATEEDQAIEAADTTMERPSRSPLSERDFDDTAQEIGDQVHGQQQAHNSGAKSTRMKSLRRKYKKSR